MSLRLERIESLMLKELSNIITFELKDPNLGFITISEVKVTSDLSYAKVYVSFLGKQERNDAGLKVLKRAKGFLKSELAKRMKLRKIPELVFVQDKSLENAKKIENILDKVKND